MRLNKMTGRVIATMGIAAMMMTQTAGVMAAEQTENKQLKVVYYNQADYPGKKIGGSTIQAAGCGPTAVAVCYSSLLERKLMFQRCANRHINMDGITQDRDVLTA